MFDSKVGIPQAARNYCAVVSGDPRVGDYDYRSSGSTKNASHFDTKIGKNAGADVDIAPLLGGSNVEFDVLHKFPA